MIVTRMQRVAGQALSARPISDVRDRWQPCVAGLVRAEYLARPRPLVAEARASWAESEIRGLVGGRLREFGSAVADRAHPVLSQLLACNVIHDGWGDNGLDEGAAWAVAWAENEACTGGGLGVSPIADAASCEARLICARMGASRLEAADALAWDVVQVRQLSPERLFDLAEGRWERLGDFLAGIVRHAERAAAGLEEVPRAALQKAAAAVAHAAAETYEWEALGSLTAAWEPQPDEEPEPEENPEAQSAPALAR